MCSILFVYTGWSSKKLLFLSVNRPFFSSHSRPHLHLLPSRKYILLYSYTRTEIVKTYYENNDPVSCMRGEVHIELKKNYPFHVKKMHLLFLKGAWCMFGCRLSAESVIFQPELQALQLPSMRNVTETRSMIFVARLRCVWLQRWMASAK